MKFAIPFCVLAACRAADPSKSAEEPGDTACADPAIWYLDADGDGFGDDATASAACTGPVGAVEAGGDCDDGDATVYPGAPHECRGDRDLDCDGVLDEPCTFDDANATILEYGDNIVDMRGDIDGDGRADILLGAPYYYVANDEYDHYGGLLIVLGSDVPEGAVVDAFSYSPETSIAVSGEAAIELAGSGPGLGVGLDATWIPDLDGDGGDDVATWAVSYFNESEAYLYSSGSLLVGAVDTLPSKVFRGYNTSIGVREVMSLGDVDGDGCGDIGVECSVSDGASDHPHLVLDVYSGCTLAASSAIEAEPDAAWRYDEEGGEFQSVWLGWADEDLDGDGVPDLVLLADAQSCAPACSGLYVFSTEGIPWGGEESLPPADAEFVADVEDGWLSGPAKSAGDLDGDGLPEILVMRLGTEIYSGDDDRIEVIGWQSSARTVLEARAAMVDEGLEDGTLGVSFGGVGDLDGSGSADVLVASTWNAYPDEATYRTGGHTLLYDGAQLAGGATLTPSDAVVTWNFGHASEGAVVIAGGADINGDGRPDALIGGKFDPDTYTDTLGIFFGW
jgi:hypothetical protein